MTAYEEQIIRKRLPEYAKTVCETDKHGGLVCPVCKSGTGAHGTSAFKIRPDGEHFDCFNCDIKGSIFDLIGIFNGCEGDLPKQKEIASEFFGIGGTQSNPRQMRVSRPATKQQEPPTDFTDFFTECNKHLNETTYHRGISEATLNRFNVGYCSNWRHPKAPKSVPASPRLIIPTSRYSYLARDTRDKLTEQQQEFAKLKVGEVHLFNVKTLLTATAPVFIVEGEIDALSIIDVGAEAVAIGSVKFVGKLANFIRDNRDKITAPALVICLDNDEAGNGAADKLEQLLKPLNLSFYRQDITLMSKDPNEALNKSREAFAAKVSEAATYLETGGIDEQREAYLAEKSQRGILQGFFERVHTSTPFISTGFDSIDRILGGGLSAAIHTIGAEPATGKTAFVLQICDYIAECGIDVLYFSLEMDEDRLLARSISRQTYILNGYKDIPPATPVNGIMNEAYWQNYTDKQKEHIKKAAAFFDNPERGNVCYIKSIGNIGVVEVEAATGNHIKLTGKKPVVVVDYLQLLTPADPRYTDKQNADRNVLGLKRLVAEYKVPVIAISSFNRESYNSPVSLKGFKESGGIEYTSEVLLGMQLHGVGNSDFDAKTASESPIRQIEIVAVKDRDGAKGTANFEYVPAYHYFKEVKDFGGDYPKLKTKEKRGAK